MGNLNLYMYCVTCDNYYNNSFIFQCSMYSTYPPALATSQMMNPVLHSFYPTSVVLCSIGSKRNSVMLFLTLGTSCFGSALTPNLFRSSAAFLALRIPLQTQWTRLKACATGIRPKLPGTLSPSTSMCPALVE